MNERETSGEAEVSADEEQTGSVFQWLVGFVVAVALLYYGREILIPLAVASLLTIVLSPIANFLERYIGRALAALSILFLVIAVIGQGLYFFAVEVGQVATEVAGYSV